MDDRLADGRRIEDVLRKDEEAEFDRYMATSFGVDAEGRPAKPPVSHIAADSGTYAAPEPVGEPDPDIDPDTHAGVRQTESDEVLEERAVDAYMRQHFPGFTP